MPAPIAEDKEQKSVAQTTELGLGKVILDEQQTIRVPIQPRRAAGKKQWKKVLLLSVGGVVLLSLAIGGIVWSKRGVVAVQTGKVMRQDLSSIVTANGEVKPKKENQANVNANSFGKIVAIFVKEGDLVKKGQLLLKTESVQQTATVEAQAAAVKTSRADIDATQAAVDSSAAALKTSQADVETAQANFTRAKDDFNRGKELLDAKLIALQVFDQRLNDYKVAQANLDAAKARVAQSQALNQQAIFNRDMSKARLAQARAQLIGAEDARSKTEYYSPLDGIVTALPVHLGENVVPGIQNQPGSLLYQISNLSVMTAEVKVDETDIVNVKLDQPSDVLIDAYPNKTFKGKVTEVGQSAVGRTSGLTSGQTTTQQTADEAKDFKVVVTVDDPPPGLRPGISATCKITTATRKNAITVPIQALTVRTRKEIEPPPEKASKGKAIAATPEATVANKEKEKKEKEELQGVFVVRNGRAMFAQVDTGIMGPTDVEVLKGVQPGDEIVTGSYKALRTLRNDSKVKIDNSGGPANAPGGPSS